MAPQYCKECKNKASYTKNELNYCLTHAKKTGFIIPTKDKSPSAIKKLKIESLISLENEYKITIDDNGKKNVILKTVIDFFDTNMMEKTNKTSADSLDLVTIGISLKKEFDKIIPLVNIDQVIIENQIGPIANRMKMIQGMIAQYFIMCGIPTVTCVSSMNKLKAFSESDQNKSEYKDIAGLCKVATKEEIATNDYSLTAGRYVGVAPQIDEDFDYEERMAEIKVELQSLNEEAITLAEQIQINLNELGL